MHGSKKRGRKKGQTLDYVSVTIEQLAATFNPNVRVHLPLEYAPFFRRGIKVKNLQQKEVKLSNGNRSDIEIEPEITDLFE